MCLAQGSGYGRDGGESTPTKVEIKGIVKNWESRDSESLTAAQAQEMLAEVKISMTLLVGSMANKIDWVRSNAYLNRLFYSKVTVFLMDSVAKEDAYTIKSQLATVFGAAAWSGPKGLFAVVEATQQRRPLLNQGGRGLAAMQTCGVPAHRYQPEWLSAGLAIYSKGNGGQRPECYVRFSFGGGWQVNEGVLKKDWPNFDTTKFMGIVSKPLY